MTGMMVDLCTDQARPGRKLYSPRYRVMPPLAKVVDKGR